MAEHKEYGDRILLLISKYEEEIQTLRVQHSTAGDVLLNYVGMGKEKRSPLHKKLYTDVEAEVMGLIKALAANPDSQEAERVVRILLGAAPYERQEDDEALRLMSVALEGLAEGLIPYLDAAVCEELGDFYEKKYPPQGMLPRQKAVYRALKKTYSKKDSFFQKLFRK